MLNHHDGVALIPELMQHVQQLLNIRKMQTGGRLIENIQRLPGTAFGQFARQLHALCFTARERGSGLTQSNVRQANVHQRLQLTCQRRNGIEELTCFFNRHIQHFVDSLAFVLNFQRFAVIALAFALIARHVDIRQEVHFDFDHAVALTGFTASATDVKAETPRRVTACA